MRWLQETKEDETLTKTLVTESTLSREALLQTKVSVANQSGETSLMMNSHESTERAPVAIEGNIDHTNQQEAQTTDSGNANAASVSVLSLQILWVLWVKSRGQILRPALLESDWKWTMIS